jgi:hypothetical protein
MWRFRGTPHYLNGQAKRLGITQILADRARHNAEIYRVSVLLAQLCERYHRARIQDGMPVFHATELAQIKGTLEQCEQELGKLHALAGSAQSMLDEAWSAFGFKVPPVRRSLQLRPAGQTVHSTVRRWDRRHLRRSPRQADLP